MCGAAGGSHVRVLEQRLFGLARRLRAVRVAVAAAVLPPAAGAQAQVGVLRDEQGHQQGQQHRAGSEEEGRAGDDGVLGGESERLQTSLSTGEGLPSGITAAVSYKPAFPLRGQRCAQLPRDSSPQKAACRNGVTCSTGPAGSRRNHASTSLVPARSRTAIAHKPPPDCRKTSPSWLAPRSVSQETAAWSRLPLVSQL